MKTKILLLLFIAIAGVSTLVTPKARAMSAAKENNLGNAYYYGRGYGKGVPQSYAKADYWYKKSAEHGYLNAELNLGFAYSNGQGVPQNYAKADYWYKKAAEHGNALGEDGLGNAYYYGKGVPQSYAKADYWYKKSAALGYLTAEHKVADIARWRAMPASQKSAVSILSHYATANVTSSCPSTWIQNMNSFYCGPIAIKGINDAGDATDATITGIAFGAQLQSSLLSHLSGSGYKNDITANMAMAFLFFVDGNRKKVAEVAQAALAVNQMVNTADLKDLNELTKLFARYIIEKNR